MTKMLMLDVTHFESLFTKTQQKNQEICKIKENPA